SPQSNGMDKIMMKIGIKKIREIVILFGKFMVISHLWFYLCHIKSPPNSLEGLSRSEEHTSELQARFDLVCRLLLEKKKIIRSKAVRTKSSEPTPNTTKTINATASSLSTYLVALISPNRNRRTASV